MSGHRQAAAALHALADADRHLILEQLAPGDQSLLRGYLDELRSLGFEAEHVAPAAAPAQPDGLASAPAAAMFCLLEHEPVELVAEVLAMQSWRWRGELLAMYHPARREAIVAAPVVAAPARARFVLDALGARLAALPAAGAAQPASPLAALFERMTSWRR